MTIEELCKLYALPEGVAEALRRAGIKDCTHLSRQRFPPGPLRGSPWSWLPHRLGEDPGGRARHASGSPEEVKSVGHSHAIPKVLRHPEGARSVLLYLCERTGRRLRSKGLAGRVIHFGFRDAEMRWHAKQKALETSTDDEERIFRVALEICEELGGFPEETTLVGVRVSYLVPKGETPRPLLPEEARKERLAQALDRIRDRWGEGAIWRGSSYASKLLVEATGGMGRQKEIALEFKARA